MPWKCPACRLAIEHGAEIAPRLGVVYRCHICRLELVIDPQTQTLTLMPLGGDEALSTRAERSE
jgi:hypothetical protein